MQQGKGSLERQPDQEVGGQALNPPIYEYNIGTGETKTEVNYSMGDKKTERVMMQLNDELAKHQTYLLLIYIFYFFSFCVFIAFLSFLCVVRIATSPHCTYSIFYQVFRHLAISAVKYIHNNFIFFIPMTTKLN